MSHKPMYKVNEDGFDCHVWGVSWFDAHTRGLLDGDHLTHAYRGGRRGCLFLFVCFFFLTYPIGFQCTLSCASVAFGYPTAQDAHSLWSDAGRTSGRSTVADRGLCPAQVCLAWRRWAACDITRDLASTWWRGRWAAARCLNHDPHITDLWALPPVFIAILRTHPVAESRYHRPHFDLKEFYSLCAPGMFPPRTCNKDRPTELEERWGDWRRKF